jgi:hypothetical protein
VHVQHVGNGNRWFPGAVLVALEEPARMAQEAAHG